VRHRALESAASLAKQSWLVREALERAIGARCPGDTMGDTELSSHQLRRSVLTTAQRSFGVLSLIHYRGGMP
jgi:hypothetical protein